MADNEIRNKVIVEFQSNLKEYEKEAIDSAKSIDALKAKIKELQKAEGDNSAEIERAKAQLREQQSIYKSASKSIDDYSKATKAAEGSQAQTQAIAALYNKELSKQEGLLEKDAQGNLVLSKSYTEAAAKAKNANDANNQFNLGVKKGYTNVGLYDDSLGAITEKLGLMPSGTSGAIQGIVGMTKAAWAFVANPIGAVIAAIVIAATALYNLFKNFDPLLDKIEQGFAAVSAVISVVKDAFVGLFTGAKSLTEAFGGLGTSMMAAAAQAAALKEAEQNLEDQQILLIESDAKAKRQIDELLLQSKDRTKSEEERIALIDEALKIEEAAFNHRKSLIDEEYRIFIDRFANENRLTAEQRKNLKERGAAYLLELQQTKAFNASEIKNLAELSAKREGVLNESIMIREKAINRQNALLEKAAEDEVKRQEKLDKKRQEQRDKDLKAEEAFIKAKTKEMEDFQKAQNAEIESARAQEEAIIAIKVEAVNKKRAIRLAEKEREKAQAQADLQNELAIAELNGQMTFDIRKRLLEQDRQAEIANAEAKGLDTFLIEEKYNLLKRQLEFDQLQFKASLAQGFFSNLATIFGKNTKVGKMAASAAITVDAIAGSIAAFRSLAGIPIVGPALGATAAAAQIVAGGKAVKDVWATKSGLPGDSGGGGGQIPRFVATRVNATANTAEGNIKSASTGLGTQTNNTNSTSITNNNGITANDVAAIAKAMPPQKLIIEEFDKVNNQAKKVETNANF